MANDLPKKIQQQIAKAGLPTAGDVPFFPRLGANKKGQPVIVKAEVQHGPKHGKRGYVDSLGRIWIRDRAHGAYPDHWDVQENDGEGGYTRVDSQGNILS